jgi:hypothetical protein
LETKALHIFSQFACLAFKKVEMRLHIFIFIAVIVLIIRVEGLSSNTKKNWVFNFFNFLDSEEASLEQEIGIQIVINTWTFVDGNEKG